MSRQPWEEVSKACIRVLEAFEAAHGKGARMPIRETTPGCGGIRMKNAKKLKSSGLVDHNETHVWLMPQPK